MAFPAEEYGGEVTYDLHNGSIAIVTMNAPARMNTFSQTMLQGLSHALDLAEESSDVRAVVITGAGPRAFCAGGNLSPDASDGGASGFMNHPGGPATVSEAVRKLR